MRQSMSARSSMGRVGRTTENERAVPNPYLGSQLEDLRVHVRGRERGDRFDDLLDLALRTGPAR